MNLLNIVNSACEHYNYSLIKIREIEFNKYRYHIIFRIVCDVICTKTNTKKSFSIGLGSDYTRVFEPNSTRRRDFFCFTAFEGSWNIQNIPLEDLKEDLKEFIIEDKTVRDTLLFLKDKDNNDIIKEKEKTLEDTKIEKNDIYENPF
jgi:hypothetical protein